MSQPSPSRQPTIFVGHGSPMNAIDDNAFTRALRAWGRALRERYRPSAILCISAHWETRGARVTTAERPRTIHDFGGFPKALYDLRYPAPGSPALARRVQDLVGTEGGAAVITGDTTWGLDHGAWTVLLHMFLDPSIPVVQLSLDRRLRPAEHLALAQKLRPLRDEGVLILGSGNIVHAFPSEWNHAAPVESWAGEFDEHIKAALVAKDHAMLVGFRELGDVARRAVPTDEHYLPLLYAVGAADAGDDVSFPYEGFEYGTLSLRCAQFGP